MPDSPLKFYMSILHRQAQTIPNRPSPDLCLNYHEAPSMSKETDVVLRAGSGGGYVTNQGFNGVLRTTQRVKTEHGEGAIKQR